MSPSSPPAASLLALAERNAALHPERLAVAGPAQRYTWAELLSARRCDSRCDCSAMVSHSATASVSASPARRSGSRRSSPRAASASPLPQSATALAPRSCKPLVSRFGVRLVITNGQPVTGTGADNLDLTTPIHAHAT